MAARRLVNFRCCRGCSGFSVLVNLTDRTGMASIPSLAHSSVRCFKCSLSQKSLTSWTINWQQRRNFRYDLRKYEIPPKYDGVEYPERRKLRFLERVPQYNSNVRPPKMMKALIDMRGPETVHNKIQYGQYALQATSGGQLKWSHMEGMRLVVNRKMDERRMFAVWRIDPPWKAISKKGVGHRMGSGKGAINHYTFPLKAGRIVVEIGGECELKEVHFILEHLTKITPFRSRVVTRESLQAEEEEEKYTEEKNINPFTFEHQVSNNMMGVRQHISPYYVMWKGKHR